MKRQNLITIALSIVCIFLSFHVVSAQTAASISGDDVCGTAANVCGPQHLKQIVSSTLNVFVVYGSVILVVFVAYRFLMAWIKLQQGNSAAYKEATKQATQAIGGFIFVVVLFAGFFFFALQFFGVRNDNDFNPLNILQLFSDAFIPHAYAQTQKYLPNPLTITNPYDFLLAVLRVIMRFVIYPGMIYMWVRSGLQFVIAQGNPEGLKKAKQWITWAFVSTFVVFSIQGFVSIMSATAVEVIGGNKVTPSTTVNQPVGTTDGRTVPAPGTTGSACDYNGQGAGSGQIGVDGICYAGRGAGSSNTDQFCKSARAGTMCTTSANSLGVCTSSESGTSGCYTAQPGDFCIALNGSSGQISADRSSCIASGGAR